MSSSKLDCYLVKGGALPPVLRKTIEAKELLRRGECRTVREAVARVGLSRSAFYKYRDGIEIPDDGDGLKAIALSLLLNHQPGSLSGVLGAIAGAQGNVRTINQSPPSSGVAPVTVTFEAGNLNLPLEILVERVKALDGVVRVELVGTGAEVRS